MAPPLKPSSFRSPADADLRRRFGHVTTWVFDLDNTLYPPECGVWPLINERITLFLIDRFGMDGLSARALHQHYYARHGATLCGLVLDNIEAEAFLEFVHDIDRSALKPDPLLAREVARLPGRKLIFTNGSRDHALMTARQLGLDGLFEDAFDILAARLTPKPAEAAYDAFFERYDIDPKHAAMFEDLPKNLAIPRAKGMTTVLVTGKPALMEARGEPGAPDGADFMTDDLAAFLGRVNSQFSQEDDPGGGDR